MLCEFCGDYLPYYDFLNHKRYCTESCMAQGEKQNGGESSGEGVPARVQHLSHSGPAPGTVASATETNGIAPAPAMPVAFASPMMSAGAGSGKAPAQQAGSAQQGSVEVASGAFGRVSGGASGSASGGVSGSASGGAVILQLTHDEAECIRTAHQPSGHSMKKTEEYQSILKKYRNTLLFKWLTRPGNGVISHNNDFAFKQLEQIRFHHNDGVQSVTSVHGTKVCRQLGSLLTILYMEGMQQNQPQQQFQAPQQQRMQQQQQTQQQQKQQTNAQIPLIKEDEYRIRSVFNIDAKGEINKEFCQQIVASLPPEKRSAATDLIKRIVKEQKKQQQAGSAHFPDVIIYHPRLKSKATAPSARVVDLTQDSDARVVDLTQDSDDDSCGGAGAAEGPRSVVSKVNQQKGNGNGPVIVIGDSDSDSDSDLQIVKGGGRSSDVDRLSWRHSHPKMSIADMEKSDAAFKKSQAEHYKKMHPLAMPAQARKGVNPAQPVMSLPQPPQHKLQGAGPMIPLGSVGAGAAANPVQPGASLQKSLQQGLQSVEPIVPLASGGAGAGTGVNSARPGVAMPQGRGRNVDAAGASVCMVACDSCGAEHKMDEVCTCWSLQNFTNVRESSQRQGRRPKRFAEDDSMYVAGIYQAKLASLASLKDSQPQSQLSVVKRASDGAGGSAVVSSRAHNTACPGVNVSSDGAGASRAVSSSRGDDTVRAGGNVPSNGAGASVAALSSRGDNKRKRDPGTWVAQDPDNDFYGIGFYDFATKEASLKCLTCGYSHVDEPCPQKNKNE